MFKADLEGIADIEINYELNETPIKGLLDKSKNSVSNFFPSMPIEERKKYKSYTEYTFDHPSIQVRYDIKPKWKDGPVYEILSVLLSVSRNRIAEEVKALNAAMEKINSKISKEEAYKNRPY